MAFLLFLCFLLTTGEARAQQADDHGDGPTTATSLTLGTTVTGVIGPDGDRDLFKFEIPDTVEIIDVWIYTEGSINDTVGGLFDGSGAQIAINDDSALSANTSHFYIGASLTPGTYYVMVAGHEAVTGPYSLHTRTGADQGKIRADAVPLAVDTQVEGIIGPAGDLDLFKIELPTQADVVMYTSGNLDTVGALLDYRGVQLTSSDDSSMSEGRSDFFIGETLGPGTYYVAVLGYSTDTGPYRLHVETVTNQSDNRLAAVSLDLNSSELGFINHRNDEDYFRLTLNDTADVWIYAVGPTDTAGELLDSRSSRVVYNDDSELSDGRLSFFMAKNLRAGTYYLKVSGFAGSPGPYRVYARSAPGTGGALETAGTLEPGTPLIGLIDPFTNNDLFRMEITESAEVVVYTTGDLDTTGELLANDGTTLTSLATDDDSGTELNFSIRQNLEPGTYYVRVGSYESETGPYALFAEPVGQLSLGGSVIGRIAEGYDEEYFKMVLDSPADVWIYGYGPLDTIGTLYDNDFKVIASNDDSLLRDGYRAFHLRESLAAGTYYVNVRSFGTGDGRFGVGAETIPDHGSNRDTATALTLDSLVPGRIISAGDADYFRLDFTEETNLFLYARTSALDPVAGEVLDSDGERVDVNVNLVYLQYPLYEDGFLIRDDFGAGTYFIKVTAESSVDYALHARHDSTYNAFIEECQGATGDPLYVCQWHLQNHVDDDADINVEPVWAEGINGTGVNVAVVDDGLDHYHEDLAPNVDKSLNHDYTGGGDVYAPFDHHGTNVAGLIASRDNSVGVRGVAPRATIYGYNFLASQMLLDEVNAAFRNRDVTAINTNSWGPVGGPELSSAEALWEAAVKAGVEKGYGGKGTFYLWAAGNSGDEGDNANLSGFTNYYATTAVCAVNDKDIRSTYSEMGASLWVCAPSSDRSRGSRGIVTTENSDRYSDGFGGTSAATPIVAGVAALLRHANPELTWRDLKLILAASARKNDEENTGWEDGAFMYGSRTERYHFNHEYGFGVVDAKAAVDLTKGWATVPPLEGVEVLSGYLNAHIPDAPPGVSPTMITRSLTLATDIGFTEFVEIDLNFSHPSFRDLEIELVSPSGKVSTLVGSYESEDPVPLFGEFRFGSAKHLGEDPNGRWTLRVTDHIPGLTGTLESWSIKVYGHRLIPAAPTVNTLTPGADFLTVAWSAPGFMRGGNITSYDLRYIPTGADETDDSNWNVIEGVWRTGGGELTAQITGLAGDTWYNVQVRAVNAAGPGPWSATEANIVNPEDVVSRYDANGNGTIEREEVIAAIEDYFDGLITREEVIAVIAAYFNS